MMLVITELMTGSDTKCQRLRMGGVTPCESRSVSVSVSVISPVITSIIVGHPKLGGVL